MLKIRFTTRMKKDLKRVKRQTDSGYDEKEFRFVVNELANVRPLDEKYDDHPLHGKYEGARDCHLRPDLVLVYEIHDDVLELLLLRIGSRSEVFP